MIGKSAAIVLAGGQGKRMHGSIPKQYLPIDGKPMIWYSLHAFEKSPVQEVILVVPQGDEESCRRNIVEHYGFRKVRDVIAGGAERADSVYAALEKCRGRGYELVAIHDGARPVVSVEVITESLNAAEACGACVIAVPVKDTIKVGDEEGYSVQTLPRNVLWAVQTPQTFRFDLCMDAYDKMMEKPENREGITDDAMVLERFSSQKVRLNMGDYRNIKVTTPEDLVIAEAYLKGD